MSKKLIKIMQLSTMDYVNIFTQQNNAKNSSNYKISYKQLYIINVNHKAQNTFCNKIYP